MDFTPVLDFSGKEPLYQQLYRQISQAIQAGTIGPGQRLPSIRQLVKSSGCRASSSAFGGPASST